MFVHFGTMHVCRVRDLRSLLIMFVSYAKLTIRLSEEDLSTLDRLSAQWNSKN